MIMSIFKPAWMGKNEQKAIDAIEKLNDQDLLKDAAHNARYGSGRIAAIEKMIDEKALAEVALTAYFFKDRKAAIQRINDEDLLLEIAVHTGDEDAIARIKTPERLLKIALNEEGDISSAIYSRLKKIMPIAELWDVLALKAKNAEATNMIGLLKMLKSIDPEKWKSCCTKKTIDKLLDLRYWKEMHLITEILWELYLDDTFRKTINKSEIEYQANMQQWESEYNHIIEMLFYIVKEKEDHKAIDFILEMYKKGECQSYIERKNLKTRASHVDDVIYGDCYFSFSTNQVEYEEDGHSDYDVAEEYYFPFMLDEETSTQKE